MEKLRVHSIRDLVTVTLRGVPDHPGIAAEVFGSLGEQGLNVEMVVSSGSTHGDADIAVATSADAKSRIEEAAENIREQFNAHSVDSKDGSALVILSGQDLATQPGIAAKMFRALSSNGINIDAISTSLASITCLIEDDRADDAVNALKEALGATG